MLLGDGVRFCTFEKNEELMAIEKRHHFMRGRSWYKQKLAHKLVC
jgi:hypothetical protein